MQKQYVNRFRYLLVCLYGVWCFSVFAQEGHWTGENFFVRDLPVGKVDGCGLQNLYQIDEGVYRSDQPAAADFKALEKYGIGEVLNLRNRHSDEDEAAGTGLRLHRVRMKAHAVSEQQLIEALRIIKERKSPVLIHCYHGSDRTGVVCALYRIVFQNMPKEQAIDEMVNGGFGFHRMYKNLIRRIRKADVERIRSVLRLKNEDM